MAVAALPVATLVTLATRRPLAWPAGPAGGGGWMLRLICARHLREVGIAIGIMTLTTPTPPRTCIAADDDGRRRRLLLSRRRRRRRTARRLVLFIHGALHRLANANAVSRRLAPRVRARIGAVHSDRRANADAATARAAAAAVATAAARALAAAACATARAAATACSTSCGKCLWREV